LIEHKYSLKRAFARHETSLAKTLGEQTIAIAQMLNRMEVVLMDNTQTTIVDAFQLSKNIMCIDKSNQVSRDHNAELREVRREEEQIRLSVANKFSKASNLQQCQIGYKKSLQPMLRRMNGSSKTNGNVRRLGATLSNGSGTIMKREMEYTGSMVKLVQENRR
jgi:hypothetical protein